MDRAVAARQAEATQCGAQLRDAQRQVAATEAVLQDAQGAPLNVRSLSECLDTDGNQKARNLNYCPKIEREERLARLQPLINILSGSFSIGICTHSFCFKPGRQSRTLFCIIAES